MNGEPFDPVQCLGCAHTEEAHDEAGCSVGWTVEAMETGCDCKRPPEQVLREAHAWADDD